MATLWVVNVCTLTSWSSIQFVVAVGRTSESQVTRNTQATSAKQKTNTLFNCMPTLKKGVSASSSSSVE